MGSTVNIEFFTRFGTPKKDLTEGEQILFRRSEELINIASASTRGIIHGSGMKCCQYTGLSSCNGEISVLLTDIPNELRWSCDTCGADGVIQNWRKSPSYLNSVKKKLREKNNDRAVLRLSEKGYNRMKILAENREDLINILDSAAEENGEFIIPISEFDIMRLIEIVALRIEVRGNDRGELSALRDEIITSFAKNSLI